MNRLVTFRSMAAVLVGLGVSLFGARGAGAQGTQGLDAWVLTNNSLVMIDTANPAAAGTPVPVTGLTAGDTLVGIDFRPINGYLYGLGFNSGAGTVRLYNVSRRTGVATPIGATGTFVGADGATPVPITGTNFGFDFEPVGDRIRVVNDAGQNFRVNPNTGAFVDGDLGGTPGSVTGLNMDGAITGAAGAEAAAYANNYAAWHVTTLYTLNAGTNSLYIQNSPKGGNATAAVTVTLNGSTLDFEAANGFDIAPDMAVSTGNNLPAVGSGLAVLTVGGTTSLYSVNLTSGAATLAGAIGTGATPVQGFAILAVRVATMCGLQGIAIVGPNTLAEFNTAGCAFIGYGDPTVVSGLVAGETLAGIDFRPQTGQLYGLGFNPSSGTGSATLYLLDPESAAATIVGSGGGVANGTGTPIDLAGAVAFGFDFNPTTDRIRVVSSNGLNFRINPNDGSIVGGALDPAINGLPAGSQGLVGAAYTNSYGQALGGGATTLYTLDPVSNRLFIQNSDSSGTQTASIPVTINGVPYDFGNVIGFDIAPSIRASSANAPAAGLAHAALGLDSSSGLGSANLVSIDLTTGVARPASFTIHGQNWIGLAIGDGPRNQTNLALTSSAPTGGVGQLVTFTATISVNAETPVFISSVSVSPENANGTVAFTIGGNPIPGCGAQPTVGMVATCTTTFSMPDTVQVAATFSGDDIHRGSSATAITQTITVATSTTSLTVTPNPSPAGGVVDVTAIVNPSGATGTATIFLDGIPAATQNISGGVASWSFATLTEGLHEFKAVYSGATFVTPSESQVVKVMVGTAGSVTQHFAEGATGFMQTDVGIFNPNAQRPAAVTVKLLPEAGDPVNLDFTLEPLGRQSIDVNSVVRSRGVPDQGFSIVVESTESVAATRQMTWGRPVYGSTLESGIPNTSKTWYFAEGATNIFSLYYMVENPNATPANIVLTHLLEGGAAPVTQSDTIPPFTRRTYDINAVPGLESAAVSTVVAADVPIVAERAMYLNTTDRLWEGGAVGGGAMTPNQFWSFAEGATGFFHTYLCLGNPDDAPATVHVTYQLSSGETVLKDYTVDGKSRRTIDVKYEDPKLESAEVGMMVSSSTPIAAERAMWWGGLPWTEGSVSLGSTNAGTVWAIGEGAEGGPSGESTFVQISNRMLSPGRLRFTVAYDDGTQEQKEYELLGSARLTVRVSGDFPNAVGRKFSVLVESLILNATFTVEYARYQSVGSFGDGGGAALATRIR